jgi:hypothetical protein
MDEDNIDEPIEYRFPKSRLGLPQLLHYQAAIRTVASLKALALTPHEVWRWTAIWSS